MTVEEHHFPRWQHELALRGVTAFLIPAETAANGGSLYDVTCRLWTRRLSSAELVALLAMLRIDVGIATPLIATFRAISDAALELDAMTEHNA